MADETKTYEPTQEAPPPEPKHKWEKRPIKLVGYMQTLAVMSLEASGAELAGLRRKLEKLTYGS